MSMLFMSPSPDIQGHRILNPFFFYHRNLIQYRYLTECYDELGTQYKVPIYCLSYPINIVKEDNGRDSPDDYSEAIDGGPEVSLKIRMSSSFSDTKLTVYSKDTISQCKKKLQVRLLNSQLLSTQSTSNEIKAS